MDVEACVYCTLFLFVHPPFCNLSTNRRRARPETRLLDYPGKTRMLTYHLSCTPFLRSFNEPPAGKAGNSSTQLPGEDMHTLSLFIFFLFFFFSFHFFFFSLFFYFHASTPQLHASNKPSTSKPNPFKLKAKLRN